MELIVLILLGGIFALWVSNQNMKRRIARIEQHLGAMAGGTAQSAPETAWAPAPVTNVPPAQPELPPEPEPLPAATYTAGYTALPERSEEIETRFDEAPWEDEKEERESLGSLFERWVAGKLMIWLGGITLVVTAILLIRYSIEIGLVTPQLRMIAAAVFGFVLLGAGEYARRGRLLADDPRFAQALTGAGIAVLYATVYGTHILYALIDPATTGALMTAVTALALVLSLRHGAPTALMGLVGGFLTPMLVGDPNSGAVRLLVYLALLDVALFVLAWRRGWTWLAAVAVGLSFLWSAWLLSRPPEDALAAGIFIILLALAASLVRPGPGRWLALMQPMAIGIVLMSALVARADLGPQGWELYGLLAAASMILAALRREYWPGPPLALLLALLLLLAKATGKDAWVEYAAAGITIIFGLGGIALALWRDRTLWTAIACAGLAGPALILRAARPELLERPACGGLMLALATGPAALLWLNRGQASAEAPKALGLLVSGAAAALLAGVASWDLLPDDLIAAGWLLIAIFVAFAARRLGDFALGLVAAAAAAIAVARAVMMVPELIETGFLSLVGEPALASSLPTALDALYSLALPALLLVGLRHILPPLRIGERYAVPAIAGLLAVGALYVWFKQAFGLASWEDFVARGLIERTIFTQILFVLGWLLASDKPRVSWQRFDHDMAKLAGTVLTVIATARLIWFDMFLHNPAWADQFVGTMPVLNLILPAYLLSAFWLYRARRRSNQATRSGLWLAAFFAALVGGTMLLVRQGFHGPILTGPEMPIAEFYGYSLAGLVLAIGLLVAGIRLPDKALRLAGLILLTATIVKVFIFDADELEGIWRILSFLGLGIALIGIGRLYGPVLRAEAKATA
jgi:uncharacterized membrane protein